MGPYAVSPCRWRPQGTSASVARRKASARRHAQALRGSPSGRRSRPSCAKALDSVADAGDRLNAGSLSGCDHANHLPVTIIQRPNVLRCRNCRPGMMGRNAAVAIDSMRPETGRSTRRWVSTILVRRILVHQMLETLNQRPNDTEMSLWVPRCGVELLISCIVILIYSAPVSAGHDYKNERRRKIASGCCIAIPLLWSVPNRRDVSEIGYQHPQNRHEP